MSLFKRDKRDFVFGKMVRPVLLAASLLLLGSCSAKQLIFPDKAALDTYDLVLSDHTAALSRRSSGPQLIVPIPIALKALDTDRIMIRPNPRSITYFPRSAWADRLPLLLQSRLIEGLNRSGYFQAVGTGKEQLQADTRLVTVIDAFHIQMEGGAPIAKIRLNARLVDAPSGRGFAARTFKAEVPASKDEVKMAVPAFNQALEEVVSSLVPWAMRHARRR